MKKAIIIFLIGLVLTIGSLVLYLATKQREFFGICLLSAILTSIVVASMIDHNLNKKP